jgi:arylsulfatase A-like enzyme
MRPLVVLFAVLSLGLIDSRLSAQGAQQPPNIVLIVADDLGYGELGCYGGQEIPTPHINSLATNGVRCSSGYVSCPVCSPTRAGLLTGRYQQRFGHEFNPGPIQNEANDARGLPPDQRTIADRLREVGYVTGLVGKWHLGSQSDRQPQRRGFDEFFGFLGGAHSYVNAQGDKRNPIMRGTKAIDEGEYLTAALAREAGAFIDRHAKQPFFLYLAFNAVHAPLEAPQPLIDQFSKLEPAKRRTFAAMLTSLDAAVGDVLHKLASLQLTDNTLIFFLSDNGGPTRMTTSENGPLRGFKGEVYEGGIRVPFLVQWKGRLPAGLVYDQPVISLDVMPTAMAAAGAPLSADAPVDGVNLLPYLSNNQTEPPHVDLYWRYGDQWAIRRGAWKLEHCDEAGAQLYDLANDIGESRNVAGEQPELVRQLKDSWNAWSSQLTEPLWKPQARRRVKAN